MRKIMKKNNGRTITNREECGVRIKQLRREKGLTQTELAGKLRVSRSSVANWENGIRFPDCYAIKQLAVILGAPIDYFYGLSNHKYNIKIPDYIELDLTRLNSAGVDMLYEYYKYLVSSENYKADM